MNPFGVWPIWPAYVPRTMALDIPDAIPNLFARWRASQGVTIDSGVSAWASTPNGYVEAQATGANQPPYVASDAAFANRPCFTYDDNRYLRSNLSASSWKFLHDGTGGTVCVCLNIDPADVVAGICGTTWSSAGRVGISMMATANWRFALHAGATSFVTSPARPALGTTCWLAVGVTSTNIVRQTSGLAYAAVAHGLTLSAAAPAYPFTIGNEGDGNFLNGKIAEVITYSRALSSAEMALIGSYFTAKYGAAA